MRDFCSLNLTLVEQQLVIVLTMDTYNYIILPLFLYFFGVLTLLEQVDIIGSLDSSYFVRVFSLGPAMRISSLLLDTGSCSTSFES